VDAGDWRLGSKPSGLEGDLDGLRGAAALTLDEFALWLNLADDYWTAQGRESIDAVVVFGTLLMLGVFGRDFLADLRRISSNA
jgi:hypothetical protein